MEDIHFTFNNQGEIQKPLNQLAASFRAYISKCQQPVFYQNTPTSYCNMDACHFEALLYMWGVFSLCKYCQAHLPSQPPAPLAIASEAQLVQAVPSVHVVGQPLEQAEVIM